MATKSLISRNTRFSKFREHVRHWTLERTKDDALKIRNARCEQGRSDGGMKKFVADRPFADPDVAARKIVELANDVDAVQNGRIYISGECAV